MCEYIYNTFACVNAFTIHQFSKLDLKFGEFKVGQIFKSRIVIDKDDFQKYISFAKTRNILHEKPELAAKEGIKGTLLPGRAIIARVEGEMTRLDIFSDSIMLAVWNGWRS